ncbi:uncharacterized protein JCM15063_005284 [Sporobolomyces koalae]|uniref:uncharacterized protein n=1 Tax=Sporobolomyces koalae TaxID=500713 RepID=UPI0031810FD2
MGVFSNLFKPASPTSAPPSTLDLDLPLPYPPRSRLTPPAAPAHRNSDSSTCSTHTHTRFDTAERRQFGPRAPREYYASTASLPVDLNAQFDQLNLTQSTPPRSRYPVYVSPSRSSLAPSPSAISPSRAARTPPRPALPPPPPLPRPTSYQSSRPPPVPSPSSRPSPVRRKPQQVIVIESSSSSSSSSSSDYSDSSPPSSRSAATPSPTKRSTPSKRSSPSPGPIKKSQCDGLTSTGLRCTRLASAPATSSRSIDHDGTPEPVYCHQHAKTALVQTGCFVMSAGRRGRNEKKREVWINFDAWILPDLPLHTQTLLRHYMQKPVSEKDTPGYIYIHELIDKRNPPSHSAMPNPETYLKLGRTIHPVLRLSQWRQSCPSLDPIVRDILPRREGTTRGFAETGTENCHRWERLCLVEIKGRIETNYKDLQSRSTPTKRGSRQDRKEGRRLEPEEGEKCRDCGKVHLECFRVRKDAFIDLDVGAACEGGGWVTEIVERWERWCRDVLG